MSSDATTSVDDALPPADVNDEASMLSSDKNKENEFQENQNNNSNNSNNSNDEVALAHDNENHQPKTTMLAKDEEGNEVSNDDEDDGPLNHSYQPGDHLIRWEMLPIVWPIQIHGIVLETGPGFVKIADFGLTSTDPKAQGIIIRDSANDPDESSSDSEAPEEEDVLPNIDLQNQPEEEQAKPEHPEKREKGETRTKKNKPLSEIIAKEPKCQKKTQQEKQDDDDDDDDLTTNCNDEQGAAPGLSRTMTDVEIQDTLSKENLTKLKNAVVAATVKRFRSLKNGDNEFLLQKASSPDGDDDKIDDALSKENLMNVKDAVVAATRKRFQKKEKNRLHVIFITQQKEMSAWKKVNYDGSIFGIGGDGTAASGAATADGSSPERSENLESPPKKQPWWKPKTQKKTTREQAELMPQQSDDSSSESLPAPKLPKSDPTKLVLARTNFLLEHGESVLPSYDVFHSNSECMAVFCKVRLLIEPFRLSA
jgi:hypothetical protein